MSQHAIPLADTTELGRLARRTTIVRVGLLLAILAAIGLCVFQTSRLHVGQATLLGPGSSGVVVLDISSSTDSAPPREIPGVLRHLANAGGRSGLVLFSDVAYEALPLGATSEELRPFLRYFRRPALPPAPVPAANGRFTRPPPITRRATPWSRSFRSGTRISAGLESARRMVLDEPSRGNDVLLVSDLNDSLFDIAALEQTLRRYKHDGIHLRIVALRPTVENRGFFVSRVGKAAFVERAAFADGLTGQSGRPLAGATPWALIGLIALLAVALAANELLCGRLEWRRA
jgi:hypothetical protein